MKVESVTYGVEFTRNLGNFENVKPNFSLTATAEDGETAEDVKAQVEELVDGWLTDKVEQLEVELKELGLGKN